MDSNSVHCIKCQTTWIYDPNMVRCPNDLCRGSLQIPAKGNRARSPSPEPNDIYHNSSGRPMKAQYRGPVHTPDYHSGRPTGGYYGQSEYSHAHHNPPAGTRPQHYYDERAAPALGLRPSPQPPFAHNVQMAPPRYTNPGVARVQSPDRQRAPQLGGYNTSHNTGALRVQSPNRYYAPQQGTYHDNDSRYQHTSLDYDGRSTSFRHEQGLNRGRENPDRGNYEYIRSNDVRRHDTPVDRGRSSSYKSSDDARISTSGFDRDHFALPNRTRRSDPALDSDRKIANIRKNKSDKSTARWDEQLSSSTKAQVASQQTASTTTSKQTGKQKGSVGSHPPQSLSERDRCEGANKGRHAPKPDEDRRLRADLDYADDMPAKIHDMFIHCSKCRGKGHRAKSCNKSHPEYSLPWISGPSPGARPIAPASVPEIFAWFKYLGCSVQNYPKYVEHRNTFFKALIPVFTEYVNQIHGNQHLVTTFHRLIDRSMNEVEQIQELQHIAMVKLFRIHIKDRLVAFNQPTAEPKKVEDWRAVLWLTDPSSGLQDSLVTSDDALMQISTAWEDVQIEVNNRSRCMANRLTDYIEKLPQLEADPAIKAALSLLLVFMPNDPCSSDPDSWLAPVRWPSCLEMDAAHRKFLGECYEQFELRRLSLTTG